MNHFNLLRSETIEFIFKKLNLNDLINLRIVDKRFKQICDQIKIKQLCVSGKLEDYSFFWFYTNDPTYSKENLIEFSKFKNYTTIFQLDKYLKRLDLDIDNFNFSILNEFKLLEQLGVTTNLIINDYKLSLDHLKIADFNLRDSYRNRFQLTFDTIKLFAFRFVNQNSNYDFIFNYPDKILFFEIDHNNNWQLFYDNYLKHLNNLQHLKLYGLYNDDPIDKDILSQFKNLKILDLFMQTRHSGYDNLIKNIKFIINEKEKLRRSEFEIYLNGVKLINQNKFNELKWSRDQKEFKSNQLEFQIKNYDLLKDNCDTNLINYCDLIKLIKKISSSFTNKFSFINQVEVNDHIDNEDQFIKFLNNLTYLIDLRLINCKLTKTFLDKLINFVYLNDLECLKIEEKNNLEMNFDFILQLKRLIIFQTNQIIANHIDLIHKLFKQNKNIGTFIFKFDRKNFIKINKWCNGQFKIRSYYLGHNLEEIDNFSIDKLMDLDVVISKLKKL